MVKNVAISHQCNIMAHAASVVVSRASRQQGFPRKTFAASNACKIGVPRSSNILLAKLG